MPAPLGRERSLGRKRFPVVVDFEAHRAGNFQDAHGGVTGMRMAGDVGERLLRDAVKDGAADAVQGLDPGKRGDMNAQAFPARQFLHKGAERRDESEVVQHGWAQVTGEAMDDVNRLSDQAPGDGNSPPQVPGTDRCGLHQRLKLDVDANQDLGDLIVQLATDLFPLFLLDHQNPVRQAPQLRVQLPRFRQQLALGLFALLELRLHRPPTGDFLIRLPVRFGQRLHLALGLLPPFQGGDVRHRQPAPFLFAPGPGGGRGLKIGPKGATGRGQKQRLAGLRSGPGKHGFQKRINNRAARRGDKTLPALLEEPGSDHAEQGGPGQVHFLDDALLIDRDITHRGEIIEVGELFQRRLHLPPGALELRVLHLQLDLMDLQFMEQPLGVGVGAAWAVACRPLAPAGFGPATESGGGVGWACLLGHGGAWAINRPSVFFRYRPRLFCAGRFSSASRLAPVSTPRFGRRRPVPGRIDWPATSPRASWRR
jgi:hypothetical protein